MAEKKSYGSDMNDDFVEELFNRVAAAQKRGVGNDDLLDFIGQLPLKEPPLKREEAARAG